ncbi:MAG: hypothetical protein CME65_06105 [Halobacteriovoraceae bacterium]|nr:hypothetical protein [Halobacteriovoraceae bacterium]|tara:strand:+ start:2008 stop:2322 length:315 start_codon:yes stop_codon:yes gene_type:complete
MFKFSKEDKFENLPEKIRDYLPTFFENRLEDLSDLEYSIEKKDFRGVRDYCHKQVGVATCYNCFKLHEIVLYIQEQAKLENHANLLEVQPILRDYLTQLIRKSK